MHGSDETEHVFESGTSGVSFRDLHEEKCFQE